MKGSRVMGLATLLLLCCEQQPVKSAKILALISLSTPSHYIFNRAVTRALAAKGHQVTELCPNIDKHPVPNVTAIPFDGFYSALTPDFDVEFFASLSHIRFLYAMADFLQLNCEILLQSPGGQRLLNYSSKEQFDLIIIEAGWNECFYGFVHKFGSPPVVVVSPHGITSWTSVLTGTPANPSFVPTTMIPYVSRMTFTQRLFNFLKNTMNDYVHDHVVIPKMEALSAKYFKENLPSFTDIEKKFSIFLVNICFGLDDGRPLSPMVIPVGGMHIKKETDPLPKDLQNFLDEAKDGFIYFSLGTNVMSTAMREEKRKALMEAFSELPLRVLWKFEAESMPGLPPNVRINKWLPQSDVLAHPNIRMFISHCGRLGMLEAAYRGVPVVGIPIYLDQVTNLQLLMSRGVAVKIDFLTLTKETVLTAVNTILNNDSYQTNMKKLSEEVRDQSETALERAVFWTEYVIRHKGAPNLKPSSTDLHWYQYLLLDVLLALALGATVLILMCYLTIRKIYRIVTTNTIKVTKVN